VEPGREVTPVAGTGMLQKLHHSQGQEGSCCGGRRGSPNGTKEPSRGMHRLRSPPRSGGHDERKFGLERMDLLQTRCQGCVRCQPMLEARPILRPQLAVGVGIDQLPIAMIRSGHLVHLLMLFRNGRTFDSCISSIMERLARLMRLITVPIGMSMIRLASA